VRFSLFSISQCLGCLIAIVFSRVGIAQTLNVQYLSERSLYRGDSIKISFSVKDVALLSEVLIKLQSVDNTGINKQKITNFPDADFFSIFSDTHFLEYMDQSLFRRIIR
jgi:hypothetical protein